MFYNIKKSSFSDITCDPYFLKNKHLYDTVKPKIFSDNNIRDQLFTNFKKVYPAIPRDNVILDIGSNIGDITDILHENYENNRFYLAEPLLLNCEATIKRFNSSPNILTINTAIGYKRKPLTWKHYAPGNMMKVTRGLTDRKTITTNISFMNLDDFYNKYVVKGDVFFLKIDVEGYEDEVLFTGKSLLSNGKIKYIYFEYHRVNNLICKTACSSLAVYLEEFGYHCYLLGKYKMIRITHGCFVEIDGQKLPHVVGIKDNYKMENKFVSTYNKLYYIEKSNRM